MCPRRASTRSPSSSNVGAPALNEVQLLLQVMLLRLVVLVDEPIAHLMSCIRIDSERRDAEVEPDGPRKERGRH